MTEVAAGELNGDPPAADQVEISIFGPGFGECVVVHLGDNNWMVVDSCKARRASQPAAIEYLESLGVDPATAVRLVVATHWHDDHVKGLAEVLDRAETAKFWGAAALRSDEFLALTGRRDLASRFTSGVDELARILDIVSARSAHGGPPMGEASAARRIWSNGATAVREVWALSPSDEDIAISREHIASLLPANPAGVSRVPALKPNDTSVVLLIESTAGSVLLGGDLEHRSSSDTRGWHAVLGAPGSPGFSASAFKVPHHGSVNADCERVWNERLDEEPVSVVTPFERGSTPLPRPNDRTRIRCRTSNGFLTSDKRDHPPSRDRVTDKAIRTATRAFTPETLRLGHVQMRAGAAGWTVGLSPEAVPL